MSLLFATLISSLSLITLKRNIAAQSLWVYSFNLRERSTLPWSCFDSKKGLLGHKMTLRGESAEKAVMVQTGKPPDPGAMGDLRGVCGVKWLKQDFSPCLPWGKNSTETEIGKQVKHLLEAQCMEKSMQAELKWVTPHGVASIVCMAAAFQVPSDQSSCPCPYFVWLRALPDMCMNRSAKMNSSTMVSGRLVGHIMGWHPHPFDPWGSSLHIRGLGDPLDQKNETNVVTFSSVQSLSHVGLFATPWAAAHQTSLSITSSWSLLKLMSIESVMPSNHLIPCHPLLLPPSIFPGIRVFSNGQFFISGGQSIGVSASASVLPMNIQNWFPLGWTGWISLQSKGLSRVFSNTAVQKHQFFSPQSP